ncbi:MAG: aldo/keto reductase [Acidimicrobiia bacterium]|nr:aldo/keto reductase [Acidimicrobiia bacterium]
MEQRTVGSTDVRVSAIGFGCMALSSTYRPTDDASSVALVHRALELGVTHLDTSDAYGWGHNEKLLSTALAGRRDQVFLASKFGQLMQDGQRIVRGDAEYVRAACHASLGRLGTDHIDLYYAHRIDPTVPIEETIGAMAELIDAGKVRHIGVSEAAPATIRRAHAAHPIAAVQVEYSLWTRFAEEEIFGVCEELGIGYVAYSPIGRGFLSGTIKATEDLDESDGRRQHPRFAQENIDRNIDTLRALQDVAVTHGASPAQVALAWVLAIRPYLLPIPGTTSADHLEENVAAADIALTPDEVEQLAAVFEPSLIAGERYPAGALAKVQI